MSVLNTHAHIGILYCRCCVLLTDYQHLPCAMTKTLPGLKIMLPINGYKSKLRFLELFKQQIYTYSYCFPDEICASLLLLLTLFWSIFKIPSLWNLAFSICEPSFRQLSFYVFLQDHTCDRRHSSVSLLLLRDDLPQRFVSSGDDNRINHNGCSNPGISIRFDDNIIYFGSTSWLLHKIDPYPVTLR